MRIIWVFFYLISKTNLSIMIKPSVVFIKGVHSTTGADKTSDIGFPQLELEKLFEGATIKVTADETYSSSKKYIYYDSLNSQIALQDTDHFNCIKNGYYSIANGINHYYTKSGNNYNYNTMPDTSTWAGKWGFSNTIKNKDLYSISSEVNRVYIDDTYYEKSGNNYVKQTQKSYTLFNNIEQINWGKSNKYVCSSDLDDDFNIIEKWQNKDNSLATSGYYISIDEQNDNAQYIVSTLHLNFNEAGICENNLGNVTLYKLDNNPDGQYIKNGNKLYQLTVGMDSLTFYTNPVNMIDYIYEKLGAYLYPNHENYESFTLYTDSNNEWHENNIFILYTPAITSIIAKVSHEPYTIYEKTAVKINYNYSDDANSLKFIFTDKDIDGVLAACNLPNDIKQYVHLTNLQYNDK